MNPLFDAIERLTNPYAMQERIYRNRRDAQPDRTSFCQTCTRPITQGEVCPTCHQRDFVQVARKL